MIPDGSARDWRSVKNGRVESNFGPTSDPFNGKS